MATLIPSPRSPINSNSGLSGLRVAMLSRLRRSFDKIFSRRSTILLKSSWAARRHRTSLARSSGGKVYPSAHSLAASTPKSLRAASPASAISSSIPALLVGKPPGKHASIHEPMTGANLPKELYASSLNHPGLPVQTLGALTCLLHSTSA